MRTQRAPQGVPPHPRAREVGASSLPDEAFAVALAGLPKVGPGRLRALLRDQSASDAWQRLGVDQALPAHIAEACVPEAQEVQRVWHSAVSVVSVESVWRAHLAAGVDVALLGDPRYPRALSADPQAPAVLFWRGSSAALDAPRVGVIGTRACTHYGRDVARRLGHDLARAGVAVVSGLALGVDAAAHLGALEADSGPPIGVVGSGLDVVYPRRHARLWHDVAAHGLLLGEAPLGAPPDAWRFPARNRIIAALCDVLVVVESHLTGGSRHTVEAAATRGVRVLAVPGPVTSAASAGTNALLFDGCGPARDARDVLVALGLDRPPSGAPVDRRPLPIGDAADVLAALDWQPTSLERLLQRSNLPPGRAATALSHLELDGWVQGGSGWWQRVAGP